MAAYTFSCFSIFTRNYEDEEKRVLIRQDVLMFLLQFAAFGTMYLATKDIRILFLYAVLTVILLAVILLYNLIYPNVSRLVVNNMCMLISIGLITAAALMPANPVPMPAPIPAKKQTKIVKIIFCPLFFFCVKAHYKTSSPQKSIPQETLLSLPAVFYLFFQYLLWQSGKKQIRLIRFALSLR